MNSASVDLHAPAPSEPTVGERDAQKRQHIIRAEANLLRLPLFALHTKGLRTLDGIECSGRIKRDGETHQFTFRATRNTATLYPGPLSRAAHAAFLSIMTDHGFPLQNPITWGWRDLCRRMQIACGGLIVRRLKASIEATAGLLIRSDYALYSKEKSEPICTRQDALHLYERVSFIGSRLADGSVADRNELWLSDWYLSNVNAMFTAPLDYTLWRRLDEKSPIASRLYEFLLLNFFSNTPVLRINYETLARFLPVRPERYRSDAMRQLDTAFHLLAAARIISDVVWGESKIGLAQLSIYRGDLLVSFASARDPGLPFVQDDCVSPINVQELRNLKAPEHDLVTNFYRLWNGRAAVRASPKELTLASEIISEHGATKAKGIVPLAVNALKIKFPDAKTFGALARYIPDASLAYDREVRKAEQRKHEKLAAEQQQEDDVRRKAEQARLRAVWNTLPMVEQEAIRQQVIARNPSMRLNRYPTLLESACLAELGRRRDLVLPPATE